VNISACVAPANAPCRTLIIHAVAASALNLQRISGDKQLVKVGQDFATPILKVVDSGGNAVSGAAVSVLAVSIARPVIQCAPPAARSSPSLGMSQMCCRLPPLLSSRTATALFLSR
jgi:hypothetical protein